MPSPTSSVRAMTRTQAVVASALLLCAGLLRFPKLHASRKLGSTRLTTVGLAVAAAMSRGRIEPGPGQESVWDYPRPPACEKTGAHVQIMLDGEVYYVPQADIKMDRLEKAKGQSSFCEWKGSATYYSAGRQKNIAWAYEKPTARFAGIKDHLAFYPSKVGKATVDGEEVKAQEGDFYGGWITSKIVGPFKGGLGTWGW